MLGGVHDVFNGGVIRNNLSRQVLRTDVRWGNGKDNDIRINR